MCDTGNLPCRARLGSGCPSQKARPYQCRQHRGRWSQWICIQHGGLAGHLVAGGRCSLVQRSGTGRWHVRACSPRRGSLPSPMAHGTKGMWLPCYGTSCRECDRSHIGRLALTVAHFGRQDTPMQAQVRREPSLVWHPPWSWPYRPGFEKWNWTDPFLNPSMITFFHSVTWEQNLC